MKLNKRNCNIRIRLTPCGSDFTKVQFKIGGITNDFFLSGVMGSQFSSLLRAIYCLYDEEDQKHWIFQRRGQKTIRNTPQGSEESQLTRVDFNWENEHHGHPITLWRESKSYMPMPEGVPDPVKIIFWRTYGKRREFTIDGRDLCYAVAKACTEALKKYGFKGYLKSSGDQYLGDSIDIEILLFIKAYALDALEARATQQLWQHPQGWMHAESSSFEKEMELLLFDM